MLIGPHPCSAHVTSSQPSINSLESPRELSVLRYRPFLFFWLSRVLSAIAYQASAVAVGWQVYALTGSAFNLGMLGLAQFLPMVILSLAAGQVADRCERRFVVRACQAIEGFALVTLAAGSFGGWLHMAGIFMAVAVIGAARSFENPTMSALLPGLIPIHLLPKAAAMGASAVQTAVIVGPALGGLLYTLGPTASYSVAAVLFFSAACLSGLIRLEQVPPAAAVSPGLKSVFLGIAFIRSQPAVLGAISLDLFAVLLGGATALLPVYAHDILHTGVTGLGMLRSAPAVGALCMSVVLARYPLERRVGRIMFSAVIAFGMATVVFGVSTSLFLSLGALLVLGSADVFSVVIRNTLVQISTPDHMRGRVSAVNALFVGTSNQLGEFESGITAAFFGTVPAVLIGGIGTIAVAVLWMFLFPPLRDADRFENVAR